MTHTKQNAPVNILLADDDIDDRLFFEKALRSIPIATHLTTVDDGEKLMDYLLRNSNEVPAILFLDLSMPRKTGFECLTEIRDNKKFDDMPIVVFTTSFGRDINFEQILINTLSNIGTQEYVRKSADVAQLQLIIHKALIKVVEWVPLSK